MKTCSQCKLFRWHVNPDTGRRKPTIKGECGWEFDPPAWPISRYFYSEFSRQFHPPNIRSRAMSPRTRSDDCPQFVPLDKPKAPPMLDGKLPI